MTTYLKTYRHHLLNYHSFKIWNHLLKGIHKQCKHLKITQFSKNKKLNYDLRKLLYKTQLVKHYFISISFQSGYKKAGCLRLMGRHSWQRASTSSYVRHVVHIIQKIQTEFIKIPNFIVHSKFTQSLKI